MLNNDNQPIILLRHLDPEGNELQRGAPADIMAAYFHGGSVGTIEQVKPEPEPVNLTPTTGREGVVSNIARERVQADTAYLASCGFTPAETLYAEGTRVIQWGRDNFRNERLAHDDLPLIEETLTGVIEAVKAEQRTDMVVPVRSLEMHVREEAGKKRLVLSRGRGGVDVEENGLRKLTSLVNHVLPHFEHIKLMDSEHIAEHFNIMIRKTDHYMNDRNILLRVRRLEGQRPSVYATVSESYGVHDIDKAAHTLIDAIGGQGYRGSAIYDPNNVSLVVDANIMADQVVDLAAGDTFKVGVQFRTNDDGGGAIRGFLTYLRNLCLNLIILDEGKQAVFRQVHRGTVQGVEEQVRAAMSGALDKWAPFAERWGYARQGLDVNGEPVDLSALEALHHTPKAVIQQWVNIDKALRTAAPNVRRDSLVELLLNGWNSTVEEGTVLAQPTAADLINSVTRIHEQYVPVRVQAGLESYAGSMLTNGSVERLALHLDTLNAADA